MPTYRFQKKNSRSVIEKEMRISELDAFMAQNPELVLIPTAPAIVRGVDLRPKNSEDFRSRLKQIKKSHRGSNINV